jgi:hypothetical protein
VRLPARPSAAAFLTGRPHSQAACVEYDSVMKLDNWKTTMLLEVRKTMQEEQGLL